MESTAFYSPIKSLINMILTGEKQISYNNDSIAVTQEFINSLNPNNSDDYNVYFLHCIEVFLSSCSNEERVDLLKVFCENGDITNGVSIINGLDINSKSSRQNDFSDTVNSVLAIFIKDHEIHPILTLSLYFYVESISKYTILNGAIAKSDYEKIIEFHSIKRDLKDLYSF